jgi:uncharacterized protein YegL
MKPTVVIVTDGGPNDEAGDRRLVPIDKNTGKPDRSVFALWPQIIMLGIDAASEKALQLFSYRNETYYKADDAMSVDQQIAKIAKKVKDAVSTSMAEPETNPDEPWTDWLKDDDEPTDLFDW